MTREGGWVPASPLRGGGASGYPSRDRVFLHFWRETPKKIWTSNWPPPQKKVGSPDSPPTGRFLCRMSLVWVQGNCWYFFASGAFSPPKLFCILTKTAQMAFSTDLGQFSEKLPSNYFSLSGGRLFLSLSHQLVSQRLVDNGASFWSRGIPPTWRWGPILTRHKI